MDISKVRKVKTPQRATDGSAGIDFFVPDDFTPFQLFPQTDVIIPSGIKANIPKNHVLLGTNKSSVASTKQAITRVDRESTKGQRSSLIVGADTIDSDYQGEIKMHIINVGSWPVTIYPGMQIAQYILVPVSLCGIKEVPESELYENVTERGDRGFGEMDKV